VILAIVAFEGTGLPRPEQARRRAVGWPGRVLGKIHVLRANLTDPSPRPSSSMAPTPERVATTLSAARVTAEIASKTSTLPVSTRRSSLPSYCGVAGVLATSAW